MTNPNGSPGTGSILPDWAASPRRIRGDLIRRIESDLLGPLEGEDEVICGDQKPDGTWWPPGRVRDRYLVGMLAPAGTTANNDPERNDDIGREDGHPDPGLQDGRTAKRMLWPSSIGLTTVVEPDATELVARCRWGHYDRQFEDHPDGSRAAVWRRLPQDYSIPVKIGEGPIKPVDVNGEGVMLQGRARKESGGWLVTVFLSNEQKQAERNKDSRWLFQVQLDLASPDGRAVFLGREAILDSAANMPEAERAEWSILDMQYRDRVELAVGHGVGVEWDEADPGGGGRAGGRRAARVGTAVLPRHEVWGTVAPEPETVPQLAGMVTDMKALAELAPDQLKQALLPLADGYRDWLDAEAERVADPEAGLEGHEDAARAALDEARRVADAVRDGIELVCEDADALDAFRFANQAMWKQRVHTVAIGRRRADPDLSLSEAVAAADIAENRSWRPFQLAFVLLCLPSLTDPGHPDRRPGTARADLLFFPTGGGKTEAYLGLVAYTMAMRRLQGAVGDGADAVDGRDGVAVLMRYTLRLLTAQQFQRAATLMCAAELLRRRRAERDRRYEGTPFRLGMWVGGAVTPNQDKDAEDWVQSQRLGSYGSKASSSPLQLSDCPWCGRLIDPRNDCQYDAAAARFLVFCGEPRECPFTPAGAPGEGLPVVTVDSQIYRLLPALVIATIDKFAQLPWNGALSNLFGRVQRRCERHGYRNPDLDRSHRQHWSERDSHTAAQGLPAARTVGVTRLRPPDLILQDEMHLVTGPLGTMAGLYETAIDRLATWNHRGAPVRPKVVASTATIRRARQQTWSVFWRDLRVFPPPVLDVHRSFFAEQTAPSDESPGRMHIGVCGHGERLKQVELRVFATLMAAAQAMYDELEDEAGRVDPWMTAVGYFNAVRELAGMRRMAEDELRTKLRRTRFTEGLANRLAVDLEELTSRISADDIKRILRRLFTAHDPARPKESRDRPVDLLLATNMISVGVDVPRLGAMVVVGQPKATAEYIQATSRVGRTADGPGLVISLFNWARPRDLSYYESFSHYHATFHRHVEPLSVTPFSERALDKGLTGVLVAELRHGDEDWNPNDRARALEGCRRDPRIEAHVAGLAARAEAVGGTAAAGRLVRRMADWRLDAWEQEAVRRPNLSYQQRGPDDVAFLSKPEAGDWTEWTCPNSLRDTEVQVNLQIDEQDPTYEAGDQPAVVIGLPEPSGLRAETAADEEIEEAIEADEALSQSP